VTDSPQGRDAPPSVAALAVQIAGLRRDVEALTAKIDSIGSVQQEHAATLDDVAGVRRQVEQILTLVSDDEESSPGGWFWLTMTDQESEERSGELFDWVETVLRPQYPGYLDDQIRPCWPNHPEARWELAWLYQLWSLAYLAKRPALKDAADWHDRWTPGVIRRLSNVMRLCDQTCHGRPEVKTVREADTQGHEMITT
jgi:hypothetical protein